MTDEDLELLLFPAPRPASQSPQRPVPDWSYIDKELRRRNVTRRLLWEEYRAVNPDGFGYTWFCTTYEAWKGRVRPSMRQIHLGGIARRSGSEERGDQDGESVSRRDDDRRDDCRAQEFCLL
ncbi:transposase [Bradyrhizobium japonicum USDA 38]|nr:transposase [Bradyrhizobium japonicum USDA 38]MCS3942701.1 transposase [Bradyrhizobium japonicum]MCW2224655.1 transposase [Bradyrhizobium japonicum]MCW2339897.1 transposase [Bradyrhizobium japonicum]